MGLASGLALLCPWSAGTPAAQSQAGPGVDQVYRLGPEDVLQIQVWGRSDLSLQTRVDLTGSLHLPLLGELDVEGQTPQQVSDFLLERYQLLDADITEVMVSVLQYNSRSVTVVGEVRSPGRLSFQFIPDLWAVLLAAGGAAPTADLAEVQIVRHDPREGEPRTLTVDLSDGIEDTPAETLPEVRPRDTIVVPSREEELDTDDNVEILGAVRTPGSYPIKAAGRLVKAISLSGGHLSNADLHKVRLTRSTGQGTLTYQLDLQGYLYDARPAVDLELQPGDVITVPSKRSTWASVLDGIIRAAPLISIAVGVRYAIR